MDSDIDGDDWIMKPEYNSIQQLTSDYFAFSVSSFDDGDVPLFGVFDAKLQKIVVPPEYDEIGFVRSEGGRFLWARKGEYSGYMDIDGSWIYKSTGFANPDDPRVILPQ
jgi:hypothetical protein